MLNGMINVYKESGYTSRDAVSRLVGILRQKKIGHTGTLDPEAEGVLPMCLGKATKLCDFFTEEKKEYRAVLKLGIATDTEDTTGVVTERTDFGEEWYSKNINEETVSVLLKEFIGMQLQIPPMYSAKRVNGKRLYQLAREGKVIERKPCEITVYAIRLDRLDLKEKEITLTIECSKGTYIRTLCKDIGERLKTKAAMKSLLRTKTGRFTVEKSYKLDEIESYVKEGRVEELLLPIEEVFLDLPSIRLQGRLSRLLENGAKLPLVDLIKEGTEEEVFLSGSRFKMYNEENVFQAVYDYDEQLQCLKVYKMF